MTTLVALLLACRSDDPTGSDSGTPPPVTTSDTVACDPANEGCDPATWLDTCTDATGAEMLPGADCSACHREGALAELDSPSKWWTVSGTVFLDDDGGAPAAGAEVHVTDSTGREATLTASASGDFHTVVYFVPPLTVEVEDTAGVRAMEATTDSGACNGCHACGGEAGRKVFAP